MKKGISLISGIIFLALTITATAIILEGAGPLLKKMQDSASFNSMKETMLELNDVIKQVASEGNGSKRVVYIKPDPGQFNISSQDDVIEWEMETNADIIDSRTLQNYGELYIGSNLGASLETTTIGSDDAYLMENERLKVYIKKIGYPSNVSYSNTDIIIDIYNKDIGAWLNSSFEFRIDDVAGTTSGTGYTQALTNGTRLPYVVTKAYMNSTNAEYDIYFILESGADFLTIEADLYSAEHGGHDFEFPSN